MSPTVYARALPPDIPSDVANRRLFAWASTTIVLTLAILSYILRIWARRKSGQQLKWDDWLMGAGLIITMEPAICEYLLMANGLGHHIWNVPMAEIHRFGKITFALQRANAPALVCIKTSILLFYMRLFPSRKFKMFAWANMAYTICWGISAFFVNLTVCTPIAFFYDKTIPHGKCKNQAISGTANGALSLLGDVMILCLPVPMIWQLHVNLRRKIALVGIFMLGGFVCVTSAIRIVAIVNFTANDATYTQVYASGWTFMEMGIAVISGNLPLLRPLFEHFFGFRGMTQASKSSNFSNSLSHSRTGVLASKNRGLNSKVDAQGFERISEDGTEAPTQANSIRDIELGDRTILVKKDFTVVERNVIPHEDLESRVKYFASTN